MSKYRNKFVIIHMVADTIEKNQYLTGMLSFAVHDSGLARSFLNQRSRKVNARDAATGLNKTRKPRTDVCY